MRPIRLRALPALPALFSLFALFALPACVDHPAGPEPARLSVVSGYGQSAPAGTTLPEPLRVQVSDLAGRALSGVTVNWEARDGSLASSTTTSDAEGITSNTWTLGPEVGTQLARAILDNGAADFTFLATATATATARTPRPRGSRPR